MHGAVDVYLELVVVIVIAAQGEHVITVLTAQSVVGRIQPQHQLGIYITPLLPSPRTSSLLAQPPHPLQVEEAEYRHPENQHRPRSSNASAAPENGVERIRLTIPIVLPRAGRALMQAVLYTVSQINGDVVMI